MNGQKSVVNVRKKWQVRKEREEAGWDAIWGAIGISSPGAPGQAEMFVDLCCIVPFAFYVLSFEPW